jgi:hypothetical protein
VHNGVYKSGGLAGVNNVSMEIHFLRDDGYVRKGWASEYKLALEQFFTLLMGLVTGRPQKLIISNEISIMMAVYSHTL